LESPWPTNSWFPSIRCPDFAATARAIAAASTNPNPATGKVVNFGYSLNAPAHVYIDIFNLMGYRVAHLEDKNQAGQANRITTWNIRNVAQGVYFYKVILEDSSGKRTELKTERLVITY
jgi:hypothetical protein